LCRLFFAHGLPECPVPWSVHVVSVSIGTNDVANDHGSNPMKQVLLVTALALACSSVALAQSAPAQRVGEPTARMNAIRPAVSDQVRRAALIRNIVKMWGPYVHAVNGEDIGLWADRLVPTFRNAETAKLQAASKAVTFEGMINALTGQKPVSTKSLPGGITPKTLGSTAGDLVFTPLASCNLVDTRNAGGAFTANIQRHFKASGANFTAQGGSNTNCGIPSNPTALLLGVTSVDAPNRGYFKMWAYGTAPPVSSATSYGPTQNSRNDIVLKVSQGLTNDFTMGASTSGADVLISVLGYFTAPEATALDCVDVVQSFDIAANSVGSGYAYCAAGYTATGAGCNTNLSSARVSESYPEAYFNDGYCEVFNPEAAATTADARVTCCRVPGR
jgi:hypothetical protein